MNTRPQSVPADWVCKPCESCERATWYPPGAEAMAIAKGIRFIPVCSGQCALKAVKLYQRIKAAAKP